MRIGLLLCDHVREHHLDIAGDYDDQFRALFSHRPDVEIVTYDAINGQLPQRPTECNGWLASGSRHSVNDDLPWIHDLEGFIRDVAEAGVPFVGICFGHQLLAKALGGSVVRSERGWGVGSQVVETANGPLRVMSMHQDQVETLPPGGEVLGWNDQCPISIMRVGGVALGIQGHPEMPVEYARRLLGERRGNVIPEETADRGSLSLDDELDSEVMANWILEFVQGVAV